MTDTGRKVAEGVHCPRGCEGRLRWLSTWTASCRACGWFGTPRPAAPAPQPAEEPT